MIILLLSSDNNTTNRHLICTFDNIIIIWLFIYKQHNLTCLHQTTSTLALAWHDAMAQYNVYSTENNKVIISNHLK